MLPSLQIQTHPHQLPTQQQPPLYPFLKASLQTHTPPSCPVHDHRLPRKPGKYGIKRFGGLFLLVLMTIVKRGEE